MKFKAGIESDKWNAIAKLADAASSDDEYSTSETFKAIRDIVRENK